MRDCSRSRRPQPLNTDLKVTRNEPSYDRSKLMVKLMDSILRKIMREDRYGAYSYRRYPGLGRAWGGAMNGQRYRCLLVAELIQKILPAAIIETGTYLGTTTEWLASFQLPIYSCEAVAHNFGFARERLTMTNNVHLLHADSRSALANFFNGPLKSCLDDPILAYLDAHWYDDLPLDDEVRLIFDRCPRAVVLIDDFKVPNDEGYTFDDYGEGKVLDANYLASAVGVHELTIRYPATASSLETGAKRGCAVLTGPAMEAAVGQVTLLGPPSWARR